MYTVILSPVQVHWAQSFVAGTPAMTEKSLASTGLSLVFHNL